MKFSKLLISIIIILQFTVTIIYAQTVPSTDNNSDKNISELDHKLLYYVERNNLDGVKKCIKDGANINLMGGYLMGRHFEAPLTFVAFNNGSIEILKYLIDMDINLELTDENNDETILQITSSRGNLEVVKYLIDAGAKTDRMTIIDWASAGYLSKVKDSVKSGADINIDNGYGTALMRASHNGHLKVVKYLLDQGADTKYMTLLNWSSAGDLDKVKKSIKSGADINQEDQYRRTPLTVASTNGNLEVVKYLIKNGADLTLKNGQVNRALNNAIRNNHIDVVKYLISNGIDINAEVLSERALNIASWKGHLNIVRLLLKSGADINAKDGYNSTALMSASISGLNQNIDIIRLLVDQGADINIKDNSGRTVLWLAVMEDHQEIVSVLIELGADINIKNDEGVTMIDTAKRYGRSDMVELLNKSLKNK